MEKAAARNYLAIPQNQDVFLIMSGGIGVGNAGAICDEILRRHSGAFTVYILVGRNSDLKQTLEEKQVRSSAIEQGLKACTQPPLAVMQLCAEGLELLERLLGKTNATAASDFGVACLSLRAGLQGAWLNACINTGSLCDAAFAADARAAGQKLLDAGLPRAERCYAAMLGACSEE